MVKNKKLICKFLGNLGITLTELIVASVMIGIVMIGVASFSGSISRLQGSTNRSTIISMRTKTVMARFVRDAQLSVGDNQDCGKDETGAPDLDCGWGVRVFAAGPDKSICFRHDVDATPEIYADDDWVCYNRIPGDDDVHLYYCGVTLQANVPVQNAADCDANGGSYEIITLDPANIDYYRVAENAAGQLEYIEITISTIYNKADPDGEDPMVNPTYSITTRVSPQGHSR